MKKKYRVISTIGHAYHLDEIVTYHYSNDETGDIRECFNDRIKSGQWLFRRQLVPYIDSLNTNIKVL
jgi:hypothetical protein